MKTKLLFIDRDGVLIREDPNDPQIDSWEKFEFIPGMISWLKKIAQETDYQLVMVTNQDGLGSPSFSEDKFWPLQHFLIKTLEGEGVHFAAVHIDKSFPHENKNTRKPGIGMLADYMRDPFDLQNSFVIGDRQTDLMLAKNLGAKGILFKREGLPDIEIDAALQNACVLKTNSWEAVYKAVIPKRTAVVRRKTNETDILIRLNLDGSGEGKIQTGIGFFDHMLAQVSRHGLLDLEIAIQGDLHIDEHHTIEDCGLALGEAFAQALGDKRGIERYGFVLPMDDCLALAAVDFGGRPWLVWHAQFAREKIGEMPAEMIFHFFKSFSDAAKCNLNIEASGENEHHKCESIFKAFAKAIKMAVRRDEKNKALPTTKGVL
ncbi:MAG: bifunctional histidinol-phosphatase/imidazoleglycerol-phosphate dehydratase [Candidatus Nephrothrix sp. EaCA]|nr:MAG: bifunctional histidinol-phosphatase/imidazoleglycerol-phosphate dehydratase [Candidatus Nephrothrix sp. EaCA]